MNAEQAKPATKLVTVKEFAAMVNLTPWSVYQKLIRYRKIPYIKLGASGNRKTKILIDPDEAIAALRKEYLVPARTR